MKSRVVIIAVLAIGLLLAALHFWGPSSVPPGQQALTVLSPENFSEFAAAFDANPNIPRMLFLLSPT